MKKPDATLPDEVLDALLDGTDLIRGIPGTRPDLMEEAAAINAHLDPLLGSLPLADPPEGLFDAIVAEIDSQPTAPLSTLRAEDGVWEQCSEKVWQKVLSVDPESGRSMFLLRCLPGASIESHVHERSEQIFIIEGELWVEGKLYSAGDSQFALAGSEHAEIKMPGGCLVLVCA